jgi:hypothetical protein
VDMEKCCSNRWEQSCQLVFGWLPRRRRAREREGERESGIVGEEERRSAKVFVVEAEESEEGVSQSQ